MPTNDKQLLPEPSTHLLRIMMANGEGWDRFVKLYSAVILAWLVRRGVELPDAEDILQDVLLSVSRNLDRFELGRSFSAWLWAIVNNRRIDSLRRQGHKPEGKGGTDFLNLLHTVAAPSYELRPDFRRELLRQALEIIKKEVTSETWEAFRLVVLDEGAYDEAAMLLNVTKRAVYQKVFKVKQRLREIVGEDGITE